MNIAVMQNPYKELDQSLLNNIADLIEKHGGKAFIIDPTENNPTIKDTIDLAICLGGDGTVLGVARYFELTETPIFAANFGHLGFLTNLEGGLTELLGMIARIVNNDFRVDRRTRIQVTINREGQKVTSCSALNDVVIKGGITKVISIKTFIGEHFVGNFAADGIMVSTPTGSTAYSLSAGGPIITPNAAIHIITPICPNILTMRPIIANDNEQIRFVLDSRYDKMVVSADGQVHINVKPGDEVIIKKFAHVTTLVRVENENFYALLSRKMGWGSKI